MVHPILNLADVVMQLPASLPTGTAAERYDLRRGEIAGHIGAQQLGCRLTVVAPGKSACPFHSHRAEEEMFVILEGSGELRYGARRHPLRAGDVIACPTGGPETAHQIINTGTTDMRYLGISTRSPAEVCEYPDSGKFGAFADSASAHFRHLGRIEDGRDYWDGE